MAAAYRTPTLDGGSVWYCSLMSTNPPACQRASARYDSAMSAAADLARIRWAKTTPADRTAGARKAALARWAKSRGKTKGK